MLVSAKEGSFKKWS